MGRTGDPKASLDGRVAFVTGGGKNLGRRIALDAASRGAAVAVNALQDSAAVAEVVDEIRAAGGRAVSAMGDVTDEARRHRGHENSARRARTRDGRGPLRCLSGSASAHRRAASRQLDAGGVRRSRRCIPVRPRGHPRHDRRGVRSPGVRRRGERTAGPASRVDPWSDEQGRLDGPRSGPGPGARSLRHHEQCDIAGDARSRPSAGR